MTQPISLITVGLFVLFVWLMVAYSDRLQRWSPPWPHVEQTRSQHAVNKVLLIGFAVFASLYFAVMLAAAIFG